MQLRQSEALGMLDHHHCCFRHIDADLDDRGSHQEPGLTARKSRHCEILLGALHTAVNEIDHGAEALSQGKGTLLRRREIDALQLFHQRTNPVDPVPGTQCPAHGFDYILGPIERNSAGIDRLASGWFLAQLGNIHVAEIGQHQRARNGSCGHHQDIDSLAFAGKRKALVHPEPVLLIDHCKSKIAKLDLLLEQRVRPDQDVDLAKRELLEDGAALATAFTPGQNGDVDFGESSQRRDRVEVLARQNLRRRHERSLAPAFDHGSAGQQRYHRLAGSDVALEQPQHALRLGQIGDNVGYRAGL